MRSQVTAQVNVAQAKMLRQDRRGNFFERFWRQKSRESLTTGRNPRKLFLPVGDWGRYAPVTAAIGHEPSSLRSSRDGRRVPMTFSDTSNHTANQRSIGDLTVETRFYPPVKNETKMTR